MVTETDTMRLLDAPRWGFFCGLGALTAAITTAARIADFSHVAKAPHVLHISPLGDDRWSGRLERIASDRSDGPLATLQGAQRAIERLRIGEAAREPVEIVIHAGTYRLSSPLLLSPPESGTAESPLVFRSAGDGEVNISGSRELTGFEVQPGGMWKLSVPGLITQQLFVNGERRSRPKLPRDGSFVIEGTEWPTEAAAGHGYDRFRFKKGDLRSSWSRLNDIEVVVFQYWSAPRLRIAKVDEENSIVTFTGPTATVREWSMLEKDLRYQVENVRDLPLLPGEWYLDGEAGVLSYAPLPGEKPESTRVEVPLLETLLKLDGDVANRKWVEHIRFEGIHFSQTRWVLPDAGYACVQSELDLGAAIMGRGARHVEFLGCTISGTGAWAVQLGEGCRQNRLERCVLTDLGAGGIRLGEAVAIINDEEAVAREQVVRDCLVAHGGRIHPAGTGIFIGQSSDNIVDHNDIFDFYHTGISVGWTFGYGPSRAFRNQITYNHLWDLGQGVLDDFGGIYTLGISRGTVLRGNWIHNLEHVQYGAWGIYLDEGTSEVLVEKNVVHDVGATGFHQHFGRDNLVRDNVFAFGDVAQLQRTRMGSHNAFVFERNIVLWSRGDLLFGVWGDGKYTFRKNLYWHTQGRPFTFGGASLSLWHLAGQDVDSKILDPGFKDLSARRFELAPTSPLPSLGFEVPDVSSAGRLHKTPEIVKMPRAFPLIRRV